MVLPDSMRAVALRLGLIVAPYQSELGFTVLRENDDRYSVFVLNSGEWSIYRAAAYSQKAEAAQLHSRRPCGRILGLLSHGIAPRDLRAILTR